MPTLLHMLTRPNVRVDNRLVNTGTNTTVNTDIVPENWRPWRGFDYATLTQIFQRDLDREYRGSAKHEPLLEDLRIFNEETMEDVLRRFEIPIVNYCLNGRDGDAHFGRGSRCGMEYKPDWSVVSPLRQDGQNGRLNVLPGVTKLSTQWWPTMKRDGGTHFLEWQKVVSQAVTYMAYHGSRYGFVITDGYLVALRLTRKPTAPGRVAWGALRATTGHAWYPSDRWMGEDDLDYYDANPMLWTYEDPEYVAVPWGAHGSGRLTIKLTLWFLAMMATNSDNFLDYSYPDLDSWSCGEDGFFHNTSGVKKSKLSRGDKAQGPDPEREAREWEAAWGAGGEDVPVFSQTGYTDYLPGDAGDGSGEGENEDGYDDDEEEVEEDQEEGWGSARPQKKSMEVNIQKSKLGRGLYFLDAKNKKKNTSKKEWIKIEGGWMLSGKKHVYFTKKFP